MFRALCLFFIATVMAGLAYAQQRSVKDGILGAWTLVAVTAAQKRLITSLDASELKFANPRTPSGMTLQTVWKRAEAQGGAVPTDRGSLN
ncbi:hypothetical protein [Bradyrhizobium yuanmingense]|uniref:hypothetical protein n=1 Tax=Bradyrhizobium yuanmingense TaxID=108015 RepID=UPI0012FD9DCB|nr:hypothetical protein [Bradyrhizobium yuanmingense]